MAANVSKRKAPSLQELEDSDICEAVKLLLDANLDKLAGCKSPEELLTLKYKQNICKVYEILLKGDFCQFDLAALDHSALVTCLWPFLNLDLFPLVAPLDAKSQSEYHKVRLATVMTCVWAVVQEHFSGKIDWYDSLEHLVRGNFTLEIYEITDYVDAFECIFYNAAQILMLSCWSSEPCDARDFDDCNAITTLEQRALVRFFIICFRRFEIGEIRKCCVQLLSHASWLHVSPQARELTIYAHNKIAKAIFTRTITILENRISSVLQDKTLLSKLSSVVDLYKYATSTDDKVDVTSLNILAKFVLNRDFINSVLNHFVYLLEDCIDLEALAAADGEGEDADADAGATGRQIHAMQRLMLCENYLELVIDLLSQLNTRRVIKPLFDCKLIYVRCKQSALYHHPVEGCLFKSLCEILDFYLRFYIDEETGTPLSYQNILRNYYHRFDHFQKVCFLRFKTDAHLGKMHLASVYECNKNDKLQEVFSQCPNNVLVALLLELGLVPTDLSGEDADVAPLLMRPAPVLLMPIKPKRKKAVKSFLVDVLLTHLKRPADVLDLLNATPLYPTEELLWSSSALPSEYICLSSMGSHKLNLQYLSLFDYLYRNFSLYRIETAYQIRTDLENVIYSMNPRGFITRDATIAQAQYPNTQLQTFTKFQGFHHMALEIGRLEIDNVKVSNVLSDTNSVVEAHVLLDTSTIKEFAIRRQWQNLRKHDVVFLVSIVAPLNNDERRLDLVETPEQVLLMFGIHLVRGAQLVQVLDEDGQVISDMNPYEDHRPMGFKLTLKLLLDYNQYQTDIATDPNCYMKFNLLIRRDPKINNFKALLSTLKRMINSRTQLPEWLHEPFLGFGDAKLAQYPTLEPSKWNNDYLDTFKSVKHFFATVEPYLVSIVKVDDKQCGFDDERKIETCQLVGCKLKADGNIKSLDDLLAKVAEAFDLKAVEFKRHKGPLENRTCLVLEAKCQGTDAGGDSNLYLVSVNETMLSLLLEGASKCPHSYRSDFQLDAQCCLMLPRFAQGIVQADGFEYTRAQIECIRSGTSNGLTLIVGPPGSGKTDVVAQIASILYNSNPNARTVVVAHSNFALDDIFDKLVQRGQIHKEYMVRLGGADHLVNGEDFSKWGRVNFLLQKRLDLLSLVKQLADSLEKIGDYDFNIQCALILFEGIVLRMDNEKLEPFFNLPEVTFGETCIHLQRDWPRAKTTAQGRREFIQEFYQQLKALQPFEVLRNNSDRGNFLVERVAKLVAMTSTHAAIAKDTLKNLKYENLIMEEAGQILEVETFALLSDSLQRVVLSGDHHQLGPIVQNQCCAKYSYMHQSLFHRLLRLQTPYILLDKQGRSRPEIAQLYLDIYGKGTVTNMEHTRAFPSCNNNFQHTVQFVNVADGDESCPIAHFYQNVREAELVVATFMYMRLNGYPRESIAIVCAYNGQRALVEDVVKAKCSWNPKIGSPAVITTIDKFQGRQAEYVLCSLVRTRRLGHINDPRRCLVAFSRAKLGLYIFGNWKLFQSSRHLQQFVCNLAKYPQTLQVKDKTGHVVDVTNADQMYDVVAQLSG